LKTGCFRQAPMDGFTVYRFRKHVDIWGISY
jgi:hypothetical protein